MRVSIVTGATRGIGKAVALALAAAGHAVAVVARDGAACESVVQEIRARGGTAEPFACDLSEAAARSGLVLRVVESLGAPTVLVHAAARVYAPTKLQFIEDDEVASSLETDLISAVALSRDTLGHMVEARFGRIVYIGSVAAKTGVSGGTLYATAKAGLEGLARGIAVDYSRRGITSNVVSVAFAETERLSARIGNDSSWRERLERATATRSIPKADEVAAAVAFLCSEQNKHITGTVLEVTAGGHLNNLW